MRRILREISCGHFSWTFKDEDLQRFSPKFRRIFGLCQPEISPEFRSRVAKPFSPYSIQKRPESQICPKFVPAIVFGGSSQGVKNLKKIVEI